MFDQTHVMIWQHSNRTRVVVGPRFGKREEERQYNGVSQASMDRLMALDLLTADWPVTVNYTMGSIFLHYTVENTSRDLERSKHTYRGPSAMTAEEQRQAAITDAAPAFPDWDEID